MCELAMERVSAGEPVWGVGSVDLLLIKNATKPFLANGRGTLGLGPAQSA